MTFTHHASYLLTCHHTQLRLLILFLSLFSLLFPLQHLQAEEAIKDRLMSASNGHLTHADATERVSKTMPAGLDDKGLVAWMDKNGAAVEALVGATKKEFAVAAVKNVLKDLSAADIDAILNLVKK